MKKIYFAASYSHQAEFAELYKKLQKDLVVSAPIYDYQTGGDIDYVTLMNHALDEIKSAEAIVIEATYKEIGVGIEAGYAKALGKKLIYIHREDSEVSTTITGISDHILTYSTITDELANKIVKLLVR